MKCSLCLTSVLEVDRARYFELPVCRACKNANIAVPIAHARWRLDLDFENTDGADEQRLPTIRATGGWTGSRGNMKLYAARRSTLTGAVEWMFGKVRVGDALFDDHVWVRSRDKRAALALLAHESVQASLLECTAFGSVVIRDNLVRCTRVGSSLSYRDVNETVRGLLVLMHYLSAR